MTLLECHSFLDLVQHRFASHCCEALLLHAATFIEENPANIHAEGDEFKAMLNTLIISSAQTLEPHSLDLISDPFGSHIIRILLIVLSGSPLEASDKPSVFQSKRKERLLPRETGDSISALMKSRRVPDHFTTSLENLLSIISASLNTNTARILATSPLANPVLQIMIRQEFRDRHTESGSSSFPLYHHLFPGDDWKQDDLNFLQQLLHDIVGSRLLEVVISDCPGRIFKKIHRSTFEHQLNSLAKSEVAVFVLVKVLERSSRHDLDKALQDLRASFDFLLKHDRTVVITTLIESYQKRGMDTEPIAESFHGAFGDYCNQRILDLFSHSKSEIAASETMNVHDSLLLQTMLGEPGGLREIVNSALLASATSQTISMSKDRAASRIIQVSLTTREQSSAFRKPFCQRFLGLLPDLAQDPVASHVVDSLWDGSTGLKFLREQLAKELLFNEQLLRQSIPGRAVLRNWKIDQVKRGLKEWSRDSDPQDAPKSKIDLARERHARFNRHEKHKAAKVAHV